MPCITLDDVTQHINTFDMRQSLLAEAADVDPAPFVSSANLSSHPRSSSVPTHDNRYDDDRRRDEPRRDDRRRYDKHHDDWRLSSMIIELLGDCTSSIATCSY
jgi:hypothetical protein